MKEKRHNQEEMGERRVCNPSKFEGCMSTTYLEINRCEIIVRKMFPRLLGKKMKNEKKLIPHLIGVVKSHEEKCT